MEPQGEDRYLVPGLLRGLETLRLFTPERPALKLTEIARALGVSRSAAFRTVYTLVETGCLVHDERARSYALGPGVLGLTYGYVATRELVEIAQPELVALRDRLGWSAHMGILEGTSVHYVLRAAAGEGASIVRVGSRLPARGTTLGRVLLAGLPDEEIVSLFRSESAARGRGKGPALPGILSQAAEDRRGGVVIHEGDFEAAVVSAAAPLRDAGGRVVAAINLTAPKDAEAVRAARAEVRAALVAAAKRVSRMLGWEG